jgi:hypothetical protein
LPFSHQPRLIGQIRDDTEKLEGLVPNGLVGVGHSARDEDHVVLLYLQDLVSNDHASPASEDILLMLDLVGVKGHPPAGLHDELSEGEVGAHVGSYENLAFGPSARRYLFGGNGG